MASKKELGQFCYQLRHDIDHQNFKNLSNLLTIKSINNYLKLNNFGLNHLILEYYLKTNNIDQFESVFRYLGENGLLKKRDIMMFVKYLIKMKNLEYAYQIFSSKIVNVFPLVSEDLELICSIKDWNHLLSNYTNSWLKLDNPCNLTSYPIDKITCTNCHNNLEKIYPTKNEIKMTIDLLKKQMGKYYQKYYDIIVNLKYTIIIDVGNILFSSGKGNINKISFSKLLDIINQLSNEKILLVSHQRHFNKKNKNQYSDLINQIEEKVELLLTPYKQNDDWYIILASILKNSRIITNDKFRDHIFDSKISDKIQESIIKNLVDDQVINYQFSSNNVIFKNKMLYSRRIQKINGIWHVPHYDNKIVCLI